jgi:cytoplasmic iron level regulating protein YaaA (DUF328/UPF0246 family)
LNARIIDTEFKDLKYGQYKIISHVKKARGFMARYVIKKSFRDPLDLREFDTQGYRFSSDSPRRTNWCFSAINLRRLTLLVTRKAA